MSLKSKISTFLLLAVSILIVGRTQRAAMRDAKEPNGLVGGFTEDKPATYTIKVGVGLAVLPVTVTDGHHHRVAGLTKSNFQVLEDGRPQEISVFEGQDAPVTVGMVVDNSLSMQPKREAVVTAALAFAGSSNPHDQIFVVTFNQTVHMGLPRNEPFAENPLELRKALLALQPSGNTALYDALVVALDHLKKGSSESKYLIVASDGGDNASRHTLADVVNAAKASDAAIYSIGIINEFYADEDPSVLKKLSKLTGGEYYQPETVPEVVEACKTIARDIRQQYTLGYVPTNQDANGKFRSVKVTATAAGEGKLGVHTRAGYLAPGSSAVPAAAGGAGR